MGFISNPSPQQVSITGSLPKVVLTPVELVTNDLVIANGTNYNSPLQTATSGQSIVMYFRLASAATVTPNIAWFDPSTGTTGIVTDSPSAASAIMSKFAVSNMVSNNFKCNLNNGAGADITLKKLGYTIS